MNLPHIDLRVRQLRCEVSPKFTARDAALLVAGAYSAVLFGLLIAYLQGQLL